MGVPQAPGDRKWERHRQWYAHKTGQGCKALLPTVVTGVRDEAEKIGNVPKWWPMRKVLCKVPGTKLEHNLKGSYDFVSPVTCIH